MDSQLYFCGVCYQRYDISKHRPLILPQCGHSICQICLEKIISGEVTPKCPYDRKKFIKDSKGNFIESPVNNYALNDLQRLHQYQECTQHTKLKEFLCKTDRLTVCSHCIFLGSHRDHDIEPLEIVKAHLDKKRKILENCLEEWDKHGLNIKSVLEKRKFETLEFVENFFEESMLKKQKLDIKFQIFMGYEEEQNRLGLELGSNSELRKGIKQKIEDYKNLQHPNLCQIMDEDLQDLISQYDSKKLAQNIQNFTQDLDFLTNHIKKSLGSQIKYCNDFKFQIENPHCKEEKESLTETIYPSLQLSLNFQSFYKTPSYLMVEFHDYKLTLTISNTLNEQFFIDINAWKEARSISINVSFLALRLVDLTILDYILSRLDKIKSVALSCKTITTNISPEQNSTECQLKDVLSSIYSQAQSLQKIKIRWAENKYCQKLVDFLCQDVFEKKPKLRKINIFLETARFTDQEFNNFVRKLSSVQENIEKFSFVVNIMSFSEICVKEVLKMPNVKNFVFKVNCNHCLNPFHTGDFEAFLIESLRSMTYLEKIDISLRMQTKDNVLELFNALQKLKRLKILIAILSTSFRNQSSFRFSMNQGLNELVNFVIEPLSNMKELQLLSLGTSQFDSQTIQSQKNILDFLSSFPKESNQ